ncbi:MULTISPECIES: hypothetical protein [unclassified Pseudoalteromonas]|uniref:hypothetical protein n=1 Tax=unclassified Pseudoalteromonas TaxID=194690 RepID=UPI001E2A84B1|nr:MULTISPECIES: hypothetical protein [unclassified Pseudoalteromonas]
MPNGSTFLQTNDNISITGSGNGDLIIHNAGGEIKLDSQGNVDITATNVLTLDGTFITFDGPVDYNITSPQTARAPSNASPANISRISDITINDAGIAATTSSVVDLLYVYQDGSPVKNAPYTIKFDDGTQSTGQLDEDGIAQLTDVPNGQFTVQYGEDTREFEPQDNTTPNPLYKRITPASAIQMSRAGQAATLDEASNIASQAGDWLWGALQGDWLWGALQGDFNKDPTTAQIVVGSIISMIPVIDQVMDVRDILANIMLLTDDDKANDSDGWIAFTLTAIGLVPVLGSAVKGVGKVVIKNSGDTIEAAIAVLRKLGKGDPVQYLRKINWQDLGKQAASEVKAFIKGLRDTLHEISTSWQYDLLLPQLAIDGMQATIKQLDEIAPKIDQGVKDAASEIGNRVNKALDEFEPPKSTGIVGKPKKSVANELDAPISNELKGAKAASRLSLKTPDDFKDIFKSLNHRKAAAGEYNAHALMTSKNYKPIGNTNGQYKMGETGIDGIYSYIGPPPKTAITEAKYNKARLGMTSDGKQMSDKWLNDERLEKAGLSRKERSKILKSLDKNDGSVEKILIRNKPDGTLVVKKLDISGSVIGTPLGF